MDVENGSTIKFRYINTYDKNNFFSPCILENILYKMYIFRGSQLRHSSDLLDRRGVTASTRARLDEVEAGLFIGSMEAATDIRNLELHRVTHIVTVRVFFKYRT